MVTSGRLEPDLRTCHGGTTISEKAIKVEHAEPDAGDADRPQRSRRSAFRSGPAGRGYPRPDAVGGHGEKSKSMKEP